MPLINFANPFKLKIKRCTQQITGFQDRKYRIMKQHYSENAYRKKRTRTLIMCGGLMEKSGLLNTLEITLGDNLQKDIGALPKAAALLGALLEITEQLRENPKQQILLWEERGKQELSS